MGSLYSLIDIVCLLGDDVAYLVVTLSIQTICYWPVCGAVRVESLFIGCHCLVISKRYLVISGYTSEWCVILVPHIRIVDIVSQQVTRIVTEVVRGAEDEVESDILVCCCIVNILYFWLTLFQ